MTDRTALWKLTGNMIRISCAIILSLMTIVTTRRRQHTPIRVAGLAIGDQIMLTSQREIGLIMIKIGRCPRRLTVTGSAIGGELRLSMIRQRRAVIIGLMTAKTVSRCVRVGLVHMTLNTAIVNMSAFDQITGLGRVIPISWEPTNRCMARRTQAV